MNAAIRAKTAAGTTGEALFLELALEDLRQAADLFRPIHDATDRVAAMDHVMAHQARGEVLTGLLFVDPQAGDMHDALGTIAQPLNALGEGDHAPEELPLEGEEGHHHADGVLLGENHADRKKQHQR